MVLLSQSHLSLHRNPVIYGDPDRPSSPRTYLLTCHRCLGTLSSFFHHLRTAFDRVRGKSTGKQTYRLPHGGATLVDWCTRHSTSRVRSSRRHLLSFQLSIGPVRSGVPTESVSDCVRVTRRLPHRPGPTCRPSFQGRVRPYTELRTRPWSCHQFPRHFGPVLVFLLRPVTVSLVGFCPSRDATPRSVRPFPRVKTPSGLPGFFSPTLSFFVSKNPPPPSGKEQS